MLKCAFIMSQKLLLRTSRRKWMLSVLWCSSYIKELNILTIDCPWQIQTHWLMRPFINIIDVIKNWFLIWKMFTWSIPCILDRALAERDCYCEILDTDDVDLKLSENALTLGLNIAHLLLDVCFHTKSRRG